jgi:hypothetical protein
MFTVAAAAALLASSATTVFAQEGGSISSVAALVAQLRSAPTEVDQFRLVADEDRLFSFTNPNTTVGVTNGAGGHTVAATSENFPAVVGQGVSMSEFLCFSNRVFGILLLRSHWLPWSMRYELTTHSPACYGDQLFCQHYTSRWCPGRKRRTFR